MGAQPDTSTSAPEVWHGVLQILAPIFVPRLLATYLGAAVQSANCLPPFISRLAVADSAEIDRRRGHSHGAQQGAVPEGAQRSGIRRAVWHGGQVPRCGDGLTLAERL